MHKDTKWEWNRDNILTVVDLSLHFIVTSSLACFFYWISNEWSWVIMCGIGGILVDIDHFVDYLLYYGFSFDLRRFFGHEYLNSGKSYKLLHSWELLAVFWALSLRISLFIPLAAGMTTHFLIDLTISHRNNPLFLSLIYRSINRFQSPEELKRKRV